MNGDMNQKRLNNIQNFKSTITGKGKIDHIPHFGNYWSWKYYDSGYPLSEALFDYEKMQDAIRQFAERYPMDVIYETGWRNPVQITSALGKTNDYTIDDKIYSISVGDQDNMSSEEYEALIANPEKYLWETFIPRKFTALNGENSSAAFLKYTAEVGKFGGAMGSIMGMLASYGIADLFDPDSAFDAWGFGYELLFNCMRGMKELAIDLRRRPDQVEAACKALDELFEKPRYEKGMAGPDGSNPEFCVDFSPVLLGHVILNEKMFERFYMPHLRLAAKYAVEKDKTAYFFVEGSMKRFWDCFRDLPADHFALQTELDDVWETQKALPNITVAGGMPSSLLGSGTPEQCVAYARKLVEELGGDTHRYIFSTDKMVSFPKDCNRENLAAVCNYLNSVHFE